MELPQTEFIEWMKSQGISPRTVYEYCMYLRALQVFTQASVDKFIKERPNPVARAFLKKYRIFLIENKTSLGLSDEQLRRIKDIYIPGVRQKKRSLPKYLTPEEIKLIAKALPRNEYVVMLWLSFYGGLRRFELMKIKASDFEWKRWQKDKEQPGILHIKGKGDKDAVVPVSPRIMKMLRAYIRAHFNKHNFDYNERIWSVGGKQWNHILKKTSFRVIGRNATAHQLRHGIAMYLQKRGWRIEEIKEFLRHSDIGTTQIYAHMEPQEVIKKYFEMGL